MTRGRFDGLLLLLLGSLLFVGVGTFCERVYPTSMIDFKVLYYPARCLLQHHDPYAKSEVLRLYQTEGDHRQLGPPKFLQMVSQSLYLPSALAIIAPIALLPWGPAHLLWMALTAGSLILAGFLMWELGASYAPMVSGGLIGLFLLGSELLIEVGNAAGIAVSLCVIAAWCFLKKRFAPAGILCFALSLAIKPHVALPVWLYFLLSGGLYRRRALQTLAVTAVVSVPAVLWVLHVAPHFPAELQANLHAISAHGNMSDPGPAGFDPQFHGAIMVSLQTVVSVFRDDPRFYNLVTYLVCAPFLLVWALTSFRKRFSEENAWFALAAIAPLSMLPALSSAARHQPPASGLSCLCPAVGQGRPDGMAGARAHRRRHDYDQRFSGAAACHLWRPSARGYAVATRPDCHGSVDSASSACPARDGHFLSAGLCAARFRGDRIHSANTL